MNHFLGNCAAMKNLGVLLLTLYWIGLSSLDVQAQEVDWLKSDGAGGGTFIADTVVDTNNYLYMTGHFYNTTTLGATSLVSAGSSDLFVAKYDAQGNNVWVQRVGGDAQEESGSIAVDDRGNSYVTGQFSGEINFGTVTLDNQNAWLDTFIAKYDSNGSLVWAKHIRGTDAYATAKPISLDYAGNVYVAGSFGGTVDFGSETLSASDLYDLFIAKYDPDGNLVWVRQISDNTSQVVNDIANLGNILYLTGDFQATASFGSTTVTSAGGTDIFLTAFDTSNGWPMWAKRAGGTGTDASYGLAIDSNNSYIYLTGSFEGTADFWRYRVTSFAEGTSDGFLAKYDKTGTPRWVQKFGGASSDLGIEVSLDRDVNPYVMGKLGTGNDNSNVFIAKFDKDYPLVWTTQATSPASVVGSGLAVANDGSVYISGGYRNKMTFGPFTLVASDTEYEIFMGHLFSAVPEPPDDLIFADGFESGRLLEWSNFSIDSGDLAVGSDAALVEALGMHALIDDNTPIGTRDHAPTSESRYRVRYYFDPNSISMAQGDSHVIFFGYSGGDRDLTRPVLRVELRCDNGNYQVRSALFNDTTAWRLSKWMTISDEPHLVELDWQAATADGVNDGRLDTWIDETLHSTITGVDNDTRRIDITRLGPIAGIDDSTRGTLFFDAFESRRLTYIGPAPTARVAIAEPTAPLTPDEIHQWTEVDESDPEEAALMAEILAYAEQEEQEQQQTPQLFLPWLDD
jgi:hypothetical protein